MNRSERLYRLTAKGREKLCARYYQPEGREPFTLINIKPIDSRTFNKIRDGLGVRKGRIIALFKVLSLTLEDADSEQVPVEGAESAAESGSGSGDSGISPKIQHTKRRIPGRLAAVGAVVGAVALIAVLAMLMNGKPRADVPPGPEDLIALLGDLRNPGGVETADDKRRKAGICTDLAAQAYRAWYRRDEEVWIERLKRIDEDLEASLEWLSKNDPGRAVQMAAALTRYWRATEKLQERAHWLAPAADPNLRISHLERGRALVALSSVDIIDASPERYARGLRYAKLAEHYYQSAGSRRGWAYARRMHAIHVWLLGRNEEAWKMLQAPMAIFQAENDQIGIALTQFQIATYCYRGNLPYAGRPTAVVEMGKALELFRALGSKSGERDSVKFIQDAAKYLPRGAQMERIVQLAIKACREEFEKGDIETKFKAWGDLGGIAVRNRNKGLQAECLFGLYKTAPIAASARLQFVRMGASLEHCSQEPGYALLQKEVNDYRKMAPPANLWSIDKYIAQGRRIPLDDAITHFGDL